MHDFYQTDNFNAIHDLAASTAKSQYTQKEIRSIRKNYSSTKDNPTDTDTLSVSVLHMVPAPRFPAMNASI
jgi:hypothetical protein